MRIDRLGAAPRLPRKRGLFTTSDSSDQDFAVKRRFTIRRVRIFFAVASAVFLIRALALTAGIDSAAAQEKVESIEARRTDPARCVGVSKGDCKKCHPSEVATWMKTAHFGSADRRLYEFTGNTRKYAGALGIKESDLLKDSRCAGCHGTKALKDGAISVISGVSCASCHGAAGGADGWLNRHQSYNDTAVVPRSEETAEHRKARLEFCKRAGRVTAADSYVMAKQCLRCHIVANEKLVAAGHKAASAFDFVSWSEGEVRHNFLLDKEKNAAEPSLWQERTGGTAVNHRRVKFVAGALAQLEMALRSRAQMKSPAVIAQVGGAAAAAAGKLSQISAVAPTEETRQAAAIATPLLATLFIPQPNDATLYTDAANKVAEQAKAFMAHHDGSKLAPLDGIIAANPPHFSQQYKEKYLDD